MSAIDFLRWKDESTVGQSPVMTMQAEELDNHTQAKTDVVQEGVQ